jgi:hypothetical protein
LLEEQKFSTLDLASADTALELGKMLSAEFLIFMNVRMDVRTSEFLGSWEDDGTATVTVRLVSSESGQITSSFSATED